tara:strand:+ start:118 stop:402 length:285 start_codon:yes stop_codon:yes gene_type:complete
MAIQFGSLRHTASGRKRKAATKTRRYTPAFKALEVTDTYRRDVVEYKSATETGSDCSVIDRSGWLDISKYTIAPAYNKGAYQLISLENIKDIGR